MIRLWQAAFSAPNGARGIRPAVRGAGDRSRTFAECSDWSNCGVAVVPTVENPDGVPAS